MCLLFAFAGAEELLKYGSLKLAAAAKDGVDSGFESLDLECSERLKVLSQTTAFHTTTQS